MNHLYYYTPRNPNARIIIKASDPYGNTYTASSDEVTTEPFANFAHYYEKEYKKYKSKKDVARFYIWQTERFTCCKEERFCSSTKIKREGAS
jgi:hypothetical protein